MEDKECFEMYAINVNAPFIVNEDEIETFWENSKKQKGIAKKLASIFGMVVSIDVEQIKYESSFK